MRAKAPNTTFVSYFVGEESYLCTEMAHIASTLLIAAGAGDLPMVQQQCDDSVTRMQEHRDKIAATF
jgi:hypothetical protein